jgi:hypothetical protein
MNLEEVQWLSGLAIPRPNDHSAKRLRFSNAAHFAPHAQARHTAFGKWLQ